MRLSNLSIRPGQAATAAIAGAAILGLATAAHAQMYQPYLYSSSAVDGNYLVQQEYNQPGPLIENQVTAGASAYAIANYGLLGGQTVATSGTNTANEGDSVTYFADVIQISSASSAANALIPYTINLALFGNYSVAAGSGAESQASVSLAVSTTDVAGNGTNVSGSHTFTDTDSGGQEYITDSGSFSFNGTAENHTTLYLLGDMSVSAAGNGGGSADSMYANTGLFNVTSTVSDVQFIGATGTNYSTLSETGSASAPEPGTLALFVPALGVLATCVARRRCRA